MSTATATFQLGLFDRPTPPPSQRHSLTSNSAAIRIMPAAASLRGRVLAHLRDCGEKGATDEEMQAALAMNPSTQRPRRIELIESKLIRDSGSCRRTRSGRLAVVWVAEPISAP